MRLMGGIKRRKLWRDKEVKDMRKGKGEANKIDEKKCRIS